MLNGFLRICKLDLNNLIFFVMEKVGQGVICQMIFNYRKSWNEEIFDQIIREFRVGGKYIFNYSI